MPELPSGVMTFLFTDIEPSGPLLEKYPEGMEVAQARHCAIILHAIKSHGGLFVKSRGEGDSTFSVFPCAADALAAACSFQIALHRETWPAGIVLKVRVALHTGVATVIDGDYNTINVNRCARLRSIAHGGQTLLSLATYELVRDDLPEGVTLREMGLHRLKGIQRPEQVYQLLHPELPSEFPPLNSLDNHRHNLPAQTTPLIGREKEVQSVCERLRRPGVRLITLAGPGGTGKTRLGLQVAAEMVEEFRDGAFAVLLAPVSDSSLVPSAIASALGVREAPGRSINDMLKEYLHDKQMLLLLDNFEQIMPAASVVKDLLTECPHLKVMVTSRIVLHLNGEHEFVVPPLALPEPNSSLSIEELSQCASVELFIQRAQAVKPEFHITNENAAAVAEICIRLEGLPLAIELAAAGVKMLPPRQILPRLVKRLSLVSGGAHEVPQRQRTLRGAIDWSYEQLEATEKALFRQLSVFVGGFSLEAAEQVCRRDDNTGRNDKGNDGEIGVFDGMASVVDKSLLRPVGGADEDEPRFTMLETVREFGLEKLSGSGEEEDIRRRHLRFFTHWAAQQDAEWQKHPSPCYFRKIGLELENLRTAYHKALAGSKGEVELGLQLALVLRPWWYTFGSREGTSWLEQLLAEGQAAPPAVRADAYFTLGWLGQSSYDSHTARVHLEQSLAIYRQMNDHRRISSCLSSLAGEAIGEGNFSDALAMTQAAYDEAIQAGNKTTLSDTICTFGDLALAQGNLPEARSRYEESLALYRELKKDSRIAYNVLSLGFVSYLQEDYSTARTLYQQGIAVLESMGYSAAIGIRRLGDLDRAEGRYEEARTNFRRYLIPEKDNKSKVFVAFGLESVAYLWTAEGRPIRAARLIGAADTMRKEVHYPRSIPGLMDYDPHDAQLRNALGEEAYAALREEGRKWSIDEALDYALEE